MSVETLQNALIWIINECSGEQNATMQLTSDIYDVGMTALKKHDSESNERVNEMEQNVRDFIEHMIGVDYKNRLIAFIQKDNVTNATRLNTLVSQMQADFIYQGYDINLSDSDIVFTKVKHLVMLHYTPSNKTAVMIGIGFKNTDGSIPVEFWTVRIDSILEVIGTNVSVKINEVKVNGNYPEHMLIR